MSLSIDINLPKLLKMTFAQLGLFLTVVSFPVIKLFQVVTARLVQKVENQ